jgi:hypothetical protein
VGRFSAPFEERAGDELCQEVDSDPEIGGTELVCKPTAVTSVVLPDGRVLFWNGVEGSENAETSIVVEGGTVSRDAQARVLDLRDGTPSYTVPDPEGGGAVNPEITEDTQGTDPPDDPYDNDGDLFCADQKHLADGRLLIAGGTDWYNEFNVGGIAPLPDPGLGVGVVELEGLRNTRIFDPATDTFEQVGHMHHGRWYPSLVTLPDGDVWVGGGVTKLIQNSLDNDGSTNGQVRITETFDLDTLEWTENDAPDDDLDVLRSMPLFPRVHLTPNGKIFYYGVGQTFGPAGQDPQEAFWGIPRFYDLEANAWEMTDLLTTQSGTVRGGAFQIPLSMQAPYDEMSLLVGGGTLGPTPGTVIAQTLSERVTVAADDTVTAELTAGQLNNPRWFSSAVLLPTGEVAAFSGADRDEVVAPGSEHPVRQAELYDPETDTWSPLASGERDRTYHNTAVLLPDGRVLVGGHSPVPANYTVHQDNPFDPDAANNFKDPSFEIFEPPYLFRGARPAIRYAPSGVAWDSDFTVDVCSPSDVVGVSLVRLPALTHTVDADMRSLDLEFEVAGQGALRVTAPPNGIAAPPGPYYLFVMRDTPDGAVPSVARIVTVGDTFDGALAPEPMSDTGPGCTSLTATTTTPPTAPAATPASVPLPTTGGPALPLLLGLGALLVGDTLARRRWRGGP